MEVKQSTGCGEARVRKKLQLWLEWHRHHVEADY